MSVTPRRQSGAARSSLVAFHWNGEDGCYWSGLRGSEMRSWQLWSIFERSFALIGEQRRRGGGEHGFRELFKKFSVVY